MANDPNQLKQFLMAKRDQPLGPRGQGDSQLERWFGLREQSEATNDRLIDKLAEIERNSTLSRAGKDDAKRALATQFIPEFGFLAREATKTAEARQRLLALVLDYRTPDKTLDPMLAYFRQKEIRDSLRPRPQSDRIVVFLKAAQDLNAEAMRAFLTAPGTEEWVTEEAQQRGEDVYGQRKDPERWEMIQDQGLLIDQLDGVKNFVAQCLLTLGAPKDAIVKGLDLADTKEPAHA